MRKPIVGRKCEEGDFSCRRRIAGNEINLLDTLQEVSLLKVVRILHGDLFFISRLSRIAAVDVRF